MGSIPNDWKHLLITKISQKSLLKILCYKNNIVTRKVKTSKNYLIKKFTSPFNLIVLNTTNLSDSFHGQTSLRNIIFSVLISAVKILLIGLRNAMTDSYIFSILYKLIHFSLPLNAAMHRKGNAPNILCPRCKEQNESQPYFIFYCKHSRITPDFISELINLKYAFNIPFKNYSQDHHNENFFSIP